MKIICFLAVLLGSIAAAQTTFERDGNGVLRVVTWAESQPQPTDADAAYALFSSNRTAQAAVPATLPTGLETPVLILVDSTTSNAYGFVADRNGDLIGGYLDHASPRPSQDVINSRIATAKLAQVQLRLDLRAVRVATATNINQVQSIIITNGAPLSEVRAATIDLRRELIDAQQQLQELRRIVRDMVKGTD
jgi:hypothetical protein